MSAPRPFISVIIPTYNRIQLLSECLIALESQNYPADRYEVIVIDDGGHVDLKPVIASRRIPILFQRQKNRGPGASRNAAARLAKGHILAFTDDDCRPDPNWLQGLATAHQKTPRCGIGGRTVNALQDSPCAIASQVILDVMHDHFNRDSGRCMFFPSNNLSFPREDYLELNGFHRTMRTAEDRDLCDRWLASGRSLEYAQDAVVYHSHPLTLRSLAQLHFAYGKGARRFFSLRRERGAGGLRIDLRFYGKLLLQPFRQSRTGAFRLLGALLLSQAANAAGYFHEALNGRKARFALLEQPTED